MIVGLLRDEIKYIDVDTQKLYLQQYISKHRINDLKIISLAKDDNILSQELKPLDTIVIANISLLGITFEAILSSIKLLAERKVYVYSIKEDLFINLCNQTSISDCMDVCMSVYRGILSLRNSKIQQDLLEQGKPRGCIHNVRKGKYILSEREEEVRELVRKGYSYDKMAKELGCSNANVFSFVRYLGLDKVRAKKRKAVFEYKLDKYKEEVARFYEGICSFVWRRKECSNGRTIVNFCKIPIYKKNRGVV